MPHWCRGALLPPASWWRTAVEWGLLLVVPLLAAAAPRRAGAAALACAAAAMTKRWWRPVIVQASQHRVRRGRPRAYANAAQERVAAEFETMVARNGGDGCGILLIDSPRGQFEVAVGTLSSFSSVAATPSTRFEIASVAKMMVAYVVLKLVQSQRIHLDTPAADFFEGTPLRGCLRGITLRQLLTHTSGLADLGRDGPVRTLRGLAQSRLAYPPPFTRPLSALWCRVALAVCGGVRLNAFMFDAVAAPILTREGWGRVWRPAECVEMAVRDYEPGGGGPGKFHYADVNYTVLGLVLETVHGAPLDAILDKEVFAPFEMVDSYYRFTRDGRDRAAADAQLAARYRCKGKWPFGRFNWTSPDPTLSRCPWLLDVPHLYTSAYFAADCVVSTARDLSRFMRAVVADADVWPVLTASVAEDPRGKLEERYGYGIKCIREGAHGVRFGHGGNGGAALFFWPEQQMVFAGTTNTNLSNFGTFVRRLMSEPELAGA